MPSLPPYLDPTTLLLATLTLLLLWLYTTSMSTTRFPTLTSSRILLLTAHPDDESMFFAPTILALTQPANHNHLKVLCLSSGTGDGDGPTRRAELKAACAHLGLNAEQDVLCLDVPQLRDGMDQKWEGKFIGELLRKAFVPQAGKKGEKPECNVDAIVTFDRGGVSGHANHRACLEGALALREELMEKKEGWASPLTIYTLTTVSLLRKYASVFDSITSIVVALFRVVLAPDAEKREFRSLLGGGQGSGDASVRKDEAKKMPPWMLFVSGPGGVWRAQRAMVRCHKSQMRWFRWGWIGFGRYLVVNDLRRVK